ncbi:unnamed protein product [Pedinophyceae sp. YPF-701]|nr:unnamed protein product [Pedinophyceae sp. YPF-701]
MASARVARKQPAGLSAFSGFKQASSLKLANRSVSADEAFVAASSRAVAAAAAGNKSATTAKKCRVAINGFGRIGRMFVRCLDTRENSNLELVCINGGSGGVKQAAHLLKYDSTMGTYDADVQIVDENTLSINGKKVAVVSGRDPTQLPWGEMDIDIVIEGTGVFIDEAGASKHLQAGAKKVLITAPGKGAIPTFVCGVNEGDYDHSMNIVSNASCTTNCLAPFVKVIDEKFGIVKGTMTTTHSYTGDQRLLDASHRDLRRARAAALSIVPTTTGAAKAVALVLPGLKGKLNGIALRVPTPTVSVVDLVVQVEKKAMAEEVNAAFKAAAEGPMKGILAITDEPLVSVDFKGLDVSTTIDAALTMVMGDDMVKVVAWYDNEWGYSQRVVDLAEVMAAKWE